MRSFLLIVSVIFLSAGLRAQTLEPAPVTHVYFPTGFDDNDVVEFVVEGQFEDTCHRVGPVTLEVDSKNSIVHFDLGAYKYDGECDKSKNDFMKVVELGVIQEGDYRVLRGDKELGVLHISHTSSPSRDDFLYAPVRKVDSWTDKKTGKSFIELRGYISNSCLRLNEPDIRIIHKATDVIEILPVMKRRETDDPDLCYETRTPFLQIISAPQDIDGRSYLIHVRTMNGQAINSIEILPDSSRANP